MLRKSCANGIQVGNAIIFHSVDILNKAAGYHRHILRLPIFVEKAFEKTITFFSSKKNTPSLSYFIIFPTLKIFWFLPKNFINRAERDF